MRMTSVKAALSVILAGHLLIGVSAELKMLTDPTSLTLKKGSTVLFQCTIQDLGSKKVIWKNLIDGSKISVNSEILTQDKYKYTIERPQDTQHFPFHLRIYDIQARDQGHYQCFVDSDHTVSVTHTLTVEEAPTTPAPGSATSDFNVTDCCLAQNMSSSCLPVCHPSSRPTDLNVVTACALDFDKVLKCGTDGRNHVGCCKRRNLPDICLDFCSGTMPASLNDKHLTCLQQLDDILACLEEGQDLLPGPPTSVSVVQSVTDDQTAMLVTWKPPNQNPQLVTGYKIFYKLTNDAHYKTTRLLSKDQLMYRQVGLQFNVQYSVYMVAVGDHGSSQRSEKFIITVLPTSPKSETEADIRACCSKKGVSDDCLPKLCTADIMANVNPVEILRCYPDLEKAQQCLVGQRNHSACCARNGLPDVCLSICEGKPTNLTLDYTACVIRLPVIDACVQEGRATIPGPPINITVLPGATEAMVTWANEGAKATKYVLMYRVLGMDSSSYIQVDATEPPIQLTNLYPGTHYEFKMVASNENGSSLFSSKVVFLTYEREITTPAPTQPSGLHNLTVCCMDKSVSSKCMPLCSLDAIASGSLDFSMALNCIDEIAKIISCASDGRDHTACCRTSLVPETCDNLCRFSAHDELSADLITCVQHTATIANCYREGLTMLPRQPRNFTVVKYTAHAVYLSWRQPEATSTRVENYTVIYYTEDERNKKWKTISTKNLEMIVNNLQPSTVYYFEVVSVNENGTSAPAPELKVMTRPYDNITIPDRCNFTMKNDSDVRTDLLMSRNISGSVGDCKTFCSVPQCRGFTYSRQNQMCILYMDKVPLQTYPRPGFDYYNHTCPLAPDNERPGNWSLQFQNRTDCCHNINISSDCLDACLNGDFQSVYKCETDYNKILTCASDGRDHTPCCQNANVPGQCLPFCRGQLVPTTGINSLCLTYSPLYMRCFLNGTQYLPTPPVSVTVKAVNGTTMVAYWGPPAENCDTTNQCHYVVSLNMSANNRTQFRTKETNIVLTGLTPKKTYMVSLLAINQYGSSIPSPVVKFVTPVSTSDVDISVTQKPFYPPPQNGEVELFCNVYAAGRDFNFVYWIRNNKIIRKGRQLTMRGLSEKDEGNYTCSAKDDRGTVTNVTHYLRIIYKPKAVNLVDVRYLANQNQVAKLQCDFMGYPTKIQWFKGEDKRPVEELTDYFHAKSMLISFPTFQRSVLSIYYVVDKAFDRYTCVGSNEFGNGSGVVQLKNDLPSPTVTTPPPPPPTRNVSACCANYELPPVCQELCTLDIDLDKVAAQSTKYGQCLAYLQFFTSCASDGKDHSKCCQREGVHPFCVKFCTGFVPDDTGSIYLMNCVSDAKIMLQCVQENVELIPGPPKVRAIQDKDVIDVSWDKPQDNAHRVEHYELFWQGSDTPSSPQQVSLSRNITDYKIKRIKEDVTYSIWVIAVNEKGSSQPSNKQNITVKNLRPSKPTSLHVSEVNGESVVLKWDPPENHAVVDRYTIRYRKAGTSDDFMEITARNTVTTYVVTKLEPNTLYEFQLIAVGPNGKSETAALASPLNSGPSTSPKRVKDQGNSAVPLGIGLTALIILLAGGLVAVYLYCRRKRKSNFGETVSFENPQYGSRIQISGLPNSTYDSTSDEGFGYAPLREDHDVEHRPTDKSNLRDDSTMDVAIT
ncbi:Ig-like and fibronectin type-III domain-containing protein 2 [Saccostrea cucullata]|uniref:Ig-like and fibronectin type-III domain-containing protein 2 n=1 Tax=Saccostrea cuccullata TaxID=36930 RepID=UPI002ED1CF06